MAIGLVAPPQQQHRQIELAREPGHRAGAHAAAPAVEAQAGSVVGLSCGAGCGAVLCEGGQQRRAEAHHSRPHQGQPVQHGGLAALLLVKGADLGPFVVVEQRQVGGAGDMPLGKLRGAAQIDQRPGRRQKGLHSLGWGAGLGAGGCELGGRGIHRLQAGMGAASTGRSSLSHGHGGESCESVLKPGDAESPTPCRADPALPRGTAGSPRCAPRGEYLRGRARWAVWRADHRLFFVYGYEMECD